MKKIIAVLLVVASFGALKAQDASGKKFRFGMKVAPGLSYMNVGKLGQENKGVNYTFAYGLNFEYAFTDYFSFSSGVMMNSFRGNVEYTDSLFLKYTKTVQGISVTDTADQILSRTYTFKSVDIPLKLKLKTPEIGYLTYYGEFGVTMNIVYDSYTSKNNVILTEGDPEAELSGDDEKLDNDDAAFFRGALNIGAGVEYNLVGNTSLLIGVNWNSGFTNILDKESGSLFYKGSGNKFNQTVKADYIALSVGVQF